ncbi:MAG: MFS transporter [Bacteroidales bacterium]|nr:MFS transporter [Bacteroidales bacterium]
MKNIKLKLILMNFLEFAVWGAYLTSQGRYLAGVGLAHHIGWFFSVQGIVSIFMPALIGILADKWLPAQKMLGLCHAVAGIAMLATGWYGLTAGDNVQFSVLFSLYTVSIAFFMPTIALSYSVAYTLLEKAGYDTVKDFPPIRVFGTVGFICSMWAVDLLGFQGSAMQYVISGGLGLVLACYAFSMPDCRVDKPVEEKPSLIESMGLKAFTLFKDSRMAVFFIFAFLLGAALQISNGFANTFIGDFGGIDIYADTFGVKHSNMLISLSQVSETLCILMIPFFLRTWGIKKVMLTAMIAWCLRFGFFAVGNPGSGVWLFVLSMIVYGVAFDFFNISGSLFVDKSTDSSIRSSAQGLFMLMTNGLGAAIGSLAAQAVVTKYTAGLEGAAKMAGWSHAWYIFAAYALVIAIFFALLFKYKHTPEGDKA